MRKALAVFFLISLYAPLVFSDGITVAGVQFYISPELYETEERFAREVESRVSAIVETHDPDLIVFPEYSSAFLALVPFSQEIYGAYSINGALARIESGGIVCTLIEDEVAGRFAETVNLLLLSQAANVERMVQRIFGAIADTYDVYIVAGTYLAVGGENFLQPELKNRMDIFGPDGTLVYRQDKVFLTDFETDLIGITPGAFSDAGMLDIRGTDVAFTICRDTFLEEWERVHAGADLWIDIKAEGEEYSQETERRFARALPARIAASDVTYGFTVCLNGVFFDLQWEGKSSAIMKTTSGVETLSLAQSVRDEEVLLLRLPPATADRSTTKR